MFRFANYEEIV